MNIQESIEILKELKKNEWGELENCSAYAIQAIETLLTAYEKEKEKNKKLQDKAKELIFEKQELTSALLDSTPNDKIKAKTIEIKNRPVKDEFITASQGKLNTIIDMESLLEKE